MLSSFQRKLIREASIERFKETHEVEKKQIDLALIKIGETTDMPITARKKLTPVMPMASYRSKQDRFTEQMTDFSTTVGPGSYMPPMYLEDAASRT